VCIASVGLVGEEHGSGLPGKAHALLDSILAVFCPNRVQGTLTASCSVEPGELHRAIAGIVGGVVATYDGIKGPGLRSSESEPVRLAAGPDSRSRWFRHDNAAMHDGRPRRVGRLRAATPPACRVLLLALAGTLVVLLALAAGPTLTPHAADHPTAAARLASTATATMSTASRHPVGHTAGVPETTEQIATTTGWMVRQSGALLVTPVPHRRHRDRGPPATRS